MNEPELDVGGFVMKGGMSIERRNKLDSILEKLRAINGVKGVWSDDWTSYDIRVVLELNSSRRADFPSRAGERSAWSNMFFGDMNIRQIKRGIRMALGNNYFAWGIVPKRKYQVTQMMGERSKYLLGYDGNIITIDIFI